MTSTRKILFVTYGGGHVAMVIPVVQHLIEHQIAEPVVMALTTAAGACRRAGVPYVGFKDFVEPGDEDALQLGEELVAGKPGHPAVEHAESVAYHGLSFRDLVEEMGPAAALAAFEREGRGAFLPTRVLERVIRRIEPDLVVTTNSPRAEQAALDAARRLGARTCCLVDVFGVRSRWLTEPGVADRICVMSDRVRQIFVDAGQDPRCIEITGNPVFDGLERVRQHRRSRVPDRSEFRVLWAPHPEPEVSPVDPSRLGDPEINQRIGNTLLTLAQQHPDWVVVVRPHPSQRDLAIRAAGNVTIVADDDLEDRLSWADVVVTCASTVGLQATLAGVPAVAIAGSVVQDYVPLADFGLAHGVELGDLEQLLNELRINPVSLGAGLAEAGLATERVVATLVDLLGS